MSEIDDYIRANQPRYTREAIDEQLRAAGHDPAGIAAAWTRVDADGSVPATRPRSAGEWIARIVLVLLIAAAYGYLGLLGIVGISFMIGYPSATGARAALEIGLLIAFALAMLVAFLFVARRILLGGTTGRRSWTVTGSVGIAAVLLAGICGICVAGTQLASSLRQSIQ